MFRLVATNFWLRHVSKRYLRWENDIARARTGMERLLSLSPMPPGTRLLRRALAAHGRTLPAVRIGRDPAAPLLLWFHGGAYCLGSAQSHAAVTAALARRIGAGGCLPDYRLAPEHPFPAAVEDARLAWRALLAEGHEPGDIVLGGDSAGGGLAFALLHLLLAEGAPPPAAVVAFSPWCDLTGEAESLRSLAERDVMLPVERFAEIRDLYLAGADPRDPRASPVFGRFRGAPPVLILASRHEALRDDSRAMAARLREDGAAVVHEEWDSVPHAWPLFQGLLPEADRALDRAAGFLLARGVGVPAAQRQIARR
jgi:monoterpene epsilon-lactone hydrolase